MKNTSRVFKAIKAPALVFFISIIIVINNNSCDHERTIGLYDDIDINLINNVVITGTTNTIQISNTENNYNVSIKLDSITDITAHSARATGGVDGDINGFDNYTYGIYWDTVNNPQNSIYHTDFKHLSEEFSLLMYGLLPSTKYYATLCVKEAGTNQIHYAVSYLEFTTLDE